MQEVDYTPQRNSWNLALKRIFLVAYDLASVAEAIDDEDVDGFDRVFNVAAVPGHLDGVHAVDDDHGEVL